MYDFARSKRVTKAYSLDDISLVPTRRTRGPEQVKLSWQIDALTLSFPIIAAPMDSVMSPETAIRCGKLGGLGVLNLEGLWTRYEDPQPLLDELAEISDPVAATIRMQQIYSAPISPELIVARMEQISEAQVPLAGAMSPENAKKFDKLLAEIQMDFFVIRGTTVSADHVSEVAEPLNLKRFIYDLDAPVLVGGCATYQTALHLMRAGASGVLVGFGGGAAHVNRNVLGIEVPMASAIADVCEARRDYLDESGGRYVQVIADGSVGRSGDMIKAIACGADAVMVGTPLARAKEAPGKGWHWGAEAWHANLPRGERIKLDTIGTLKEVLLGPSHVSDGTMNLVGALRRAMASTGYTDIKSFQRIEIMIR